LAELPKDLLFAEFSNLEIARAAERHRACMTKGLPKALRGLYCSGGAWASDGLTGDDAVTVVIKRHNQEFDDLGHKPASSLTPSRNGIFEFFLR
jgi:hypothetical protein